MKREIGPWLTDEDIHAIREGICEAALGMSIEEQIAYYNGLGKETEAELARRRLAKAADSAMAMPSASQPAFAGA